MEVASRPFLDNLVSMVRYGVCLFPPPLGLFCRLYFTLLFFFFLLGFQVDTNYDVKIKVLELIQAWGTVFTGQHELSYACEVYSNLRSDGENLIESICLAFPDTNLFLGVVFPTLRSETTEIMLDAVTVSLADSLSICPNSLSIFFFFSLVSSKAPEWSDSDVCMRCRQPFTMIRRKVCLFFVPQASLI